MKKKYVQYSATWVFLAFVLVFAILLCALPVKEFSENEKRVLQGFPKFSWERLISGEFSADLDTWSSDQFPFRDFFVGVNGYAKYYLGMSGTTGIYVGADGRLFGVPADIDEARLERNVSRISAFAKAKGLPTTLLMVPSAGSMLEDLLPKNHESYPDDRIYEIAMSKADGLTVPDLRKVFVNKADCFYRTDHHLTMEGSYQMYLAYCKAAGLEPITDYSNKETLTDFYGTHYSKSGLWLTEPDTLEIWHPNDESGFTVTIDDLTEKNTYDSLYFYEHDRELDKYPVYLNGNHAVVTIENKNCQNGKRLMVVKDSYAHCISTLLCQQYESICLVDLRYYRGGVTALMEEQESTELLFLFGADNLAGLGELALLR